MSMIRRNPPNNRVVAVAQESGAGAAVMIVGVLALFLVLQTLVAAVITLAAVLVIGAIVWMVFLRKRSPQLFRSFRSYRPFDRD